MTDLQKEWIFDPSRLAKDRIERLLEPMPRERLLELIRDQFFGIRFAWKKGDLEARGHHRSEFILECPPTVCDLFFNGISGVRSKYYCGINHGREFSGYLIAGLADILVACAKRNGPRCRREQGSVLIVWNIGKDLDLGERLFTRSRMHGCCVLADFEGSALGASSPSSRIRD
jgi:hypothetical protein